MNQPTREEHEELKRRVAKLERQTEPMRIMRLEIDAGSIYRQLDSIQEDTNTLKIQMEGVRTDILSIKATQSDHTAFHIEHRQRLKEIEEKQDAHSEILGQLVNFAESHDVTLKTVATKEDLSKLEAHFSADIAALKAAQAEQGQKLDLILNLLQPKGE